ncbi:hypothetical protein MASR1M31_25370 [Porphyromonadaceae bacterium]
MTNGDISIPSHIYKCPYEGEKCKCGKHCHVLETVGELSNQITVLLQCPQQKIKIPVVIGP